MKDEPAPEITATEAIKRLNSDEYWAEKDRVLNEKLIVLFDPMFKGVKVILNKSKERG